MRAARRLFTVVVCAGVGWALLLTVGAYALRGYVTRRVERRIAAALDAHVEVGSSSLSLWAGRVDLHDVRVHRGHGGKVELRIATLVIEYPGGGAMLLRGRARAAAVRGAELTVSARGIYDLAARRRRLRPIALRYLAIDDARIVAVPTSLLPGFGRVTLELGRARAHGVSMRDALSWLYGLDELQAAVELPGRQRYAVGYGGGQLSLSGGLLGSAPITVAFRLPPPGEGYELAQLQAIGRALRAALEDKVKARIAERMGGRVVNTVRSWIP